MKTNAHTEAKLNQVQISSIGQAKGDHLMRKPHTAFALSVFAACIASSASAETLSSIVTVEGQNGPSLFNFRAPAIGVDASTITVQESYQINGLMNDGLPGAMVFEAEASAQAGFQSLRAAYRVSVLNAFYNPANPSYDPNTGTGAPRAVGGQANASFEDTVTIESGAGLTEIRFVVRMTGFGEQLSGSYPFGAGYVAMWQDRPTGGSSIISDSRIDWPVNGVVEQTFLTRPYAVTDGVAEVDLLLQVVNDFLLDFIDQGDDVTALMDFSNTAQIIGVEGDDAMGNSVEIFSVIGTSGTDYLAAPMINVEPLPPGGTVSPLPAISLGDLGALVESSTGNFSVRDTQNGNAIVATGTVERGVWRAADDTLTFSWQVNNDASSSVAIEALRIGGFDDAQIGVAVVSGPNGVEPVRAFRFSGASAGSFNFSFNNNFGSDIGVDPGASSTLIVAATQSTEYEFVSRGDVTADPFQLGFFGGVFVPLPLPADTDGDAVPDAQDNCLLVANPTQRDTDGDGFGNLCDPDLNNDLVVNVQDLGLLRAVFFTADADADFDGDGQVNVVDLGIMRTFFFEAPGPGAATR